MNTDYATAIGYGGENKSPAAFRSISEVATNLGIPQHVLRFWESKFQEIKPVKQRNGRRYYRPEDVELIGNIREMLYEQGYTIRGVQKFLKERERASPIRAMVPAPQVPTTLQSFDGKDGLSLETRHALEDILKELKALKDRIRQSGFLLTAL